MDVTLLVPTINRSEFLIRLLGYYESLKFRGWICIGDSSTGEHLRRTKEALGGFQGGLNIVYREYPGMDDAECLEQLLGFVSTTYAAWVADDDFMIPSALDRCARFLDSHPDYVAARGLATMFRLESPGAHGPLATAGYYKGRAVEADSAAQRLIDHLSNYSTNLFSVHRVEAWRVMYRDPLQVPDRLFRGEFLAGCRGIIQGRLKKLDCLYMVRQNHGGRTIWDSYDWITSEAWLPSYEIFRDRLSEELAERDGISVDSARAVVKEAFRPYLARSLARVPEGNHSGDGVTHRSGLRGTARGIPGVSRTWRTLRSFLPGEEHKMSLPALLRHTSPYHADFMPVYRAVTGPPHTSRGDIADGSSP